jgi:hypothetical protein
MIRQAQDHDMMASYVAFDLSRNKQRGMTMSS